MDPARRRHARRARDTIVMAPPTCWHGGAGSGQALLADAADITTRSDLAPRLFTGLVEKRPDQDALLAAMRANRDEELAAIARAAADEATSERLAVLYKIDR